MIAYWEYLETFCYLPYTVFFLLNFRNINDSEIATNAMSLISFIHEVSMVYLLSLYFFLFHFLQQMVNFNHSSNQGILLPVLLIVMKYSLSAWKHFFKIIINNWIKPILLTNPKTIGHKFYNIDACSPLLSIQHWL